MSGTRLGQVLAYAARGWPVFPCQAGQKTPATAHGHLDATTDPGQITAWFDRHPDWNLAIATGAPGPDVLDVDDHGPTGNGYAAFARLSKAGLLDSAARFVRTPSGGLHAYFTGSAQRNGHLPAHHLDFRSRGGYVLAPPWSTPGLVETRFSPDALVWVAVVFHGTAAWRNHGLIIFPLLFIEHLSSYAVQLPRLVARAPPARPPAGAWASPRRAPALRRGFPGLGKG